MSQHNAVPVEVYRTYNVSVVKATNNDYVPPKEKHVRRLMMITYNPGNGYDHPRVGSEDIVTAIKRRFSSGSPIIVLKSLILLHRLMQEGDVRFAKVCKERPSIFALGPFQDAERGLGYELAEYAKRYVVYLNSRALFLRDAGFDIDHDEKDAILHSCRRLDSTKVAELLPVVLKLMQALVKIGIQPASFKDPVVCSANILLLKDSFHLYRFSNEISLNILDNCTEWYKSPSERDRVNNLFTQLQQFVALTSSLNALYAASRRVLPEAESSFPTLTIPSAIVIEELRKSFAEYEENENIPVANLSDDDDDDDERIIDVEVDMQPPSPMGQQSWDPFEVRPEESEHNRSSATFHSNSGQTAAMNDPFGMDSSTTRSTGAELVAAADPFGSLYGQESRASDGFKVSASSFSTDPFSMADKNENKNTNKIDPFAPQTRGADPFSAGTAEPLAAFPHRSPAQSQLSFDNDLVQLSSIQSAKESITSLYRASHLSNQSGTASNPMQMGYGGASNSSGGIIGGGSNLNQRPNMSYQNQPIMQTPLMPKGQAVSHFGFVASEPVKGPQNSKQTSVKDPFAELSWK